MDVLKEYDQMPPLYKEIYYLVNFKSGKELHKFVSKVIKAIENNQVNASLKKELEDKMIGYIEKGVPQSELQLIKNLLPYKYNVVDIYQNYEDFRKYIGKTKTSTTIEIRKKINEVLINTVFPNALSKEEAIKIKELFRTINLEEIMEEINSLELKEQKRIATYEKEAPKRKKIGSAINRELLKIAPKIKEDVNKRDNFFTNLRFSEKRIGFFIKPDIGKDREIVTEYLKRATKSDRLFLELDDENENYFVSFSDSSDLAFLRVLLGQMFMKEPLEGFKLLGIPIQVIIEHCQYKGIPICEPEWHELDFNTYYESIKNGIFAFNNRLQIKSYSEDSIRFAINQLMNATKFESELYLACYLHFNFLLPMQEYVNKREEYFEKNNVSISKEEYKEKREEIYKQLVLNGSANVKWKNEVDLYKLVLKDYPDAIFQYGSEWLEKQSLDIFIPSLNTAIEYQGQQHYEPIMHFGGEEAFIHRQKLDALKMEKCKNNGVRLIHWNYKDVISRTNLNRIIHK